jgi:glycolate oxidase FAD binding subunit
MASILKPRDARDVAEVAAWAAAEGQPLEVLGHASKRALGRPVQAEHTLDLSGLAGILSYEPAELFMTALPGTPRAEIEAALAARGQTLPFEPIDLAALYAAGRGSIGGIFAANLAGPRRFKAGAARDHLLGFKAVSGRGESFKSGGTVVKNVTGYDLSKLACGSFGTLACFTELTFKVLPAAEKTRTLLLYGLDDRAAIAAMARAAGAPHEVSGLAHLPAAAAARSEVGYVRDLGKPVTAMRLEGTAISVAARLDALRAMFPGTAQEELHGMNSGRLWTEIRDVAALIDAPLVWRLSVPPSDGAATVERVRQAGVPMRGWLYDQAGGLVWLGLDGADAMPDAVRRVLPPGDGHAMLTKAPEPLRAATAVFQPEPPALAALTRRVKEAFDPKRILNPGRMWAGI